jgi:Flagellar hook-length control protein FliK
MLPRDPLAPTAVARTGAVLAVADPRQQAFQRALVGQLGQAMQAEVLAKLADGSYVVRVADMAARMPLPQNVAVGTQVPLTLVALHPRPTFQVTTSQGGQAFAEAGPAPGEGAAAQPTPLAWLEGKEAAALTRAAALLAKTQSLPTPAGTSGDAGASLSKTGKALGDVIAAAQKADAPATAALGRTPLLGAPGADAGRIAAALRQGLEKSGLFYESHVAEWAQGTRAQAELAAEPQARGMAPPTDPATAQLINLQLNAHEQARVAWQGQLWPGQEMRWEIEREHERDAPEEGRASGDGEDAAGWTSSLTLRFGRLGEVAAKVVLSGGRLHIRLDAPEPARALLEAGRGRLADALAAAGTPLNTLAIHGDGERR